MVVVVVLGALGLAAPVPAGAGGKAEPAAQASFARAHR